MLHGNPDGTANGIAAPWALNASPGDKMSLFGPGNATFINTDADWFLLAADMRALPALTAKRSVVETARQATLAHEAYAVRQKRAY